MPLPIGLLEWNPATGTRTITEISANGSGDTATNPNYHVYRWNSLDTINLSGTEWQVVSFWDVNENLVLGVRSASPGSISAASWTLYVYDGVAETPEISRTEFDNHNDCNIGLDSNGYIHIAYDHHNNSLNYRRSTAAISSFSGTLTSTLSMVTMQSRVAYPTFFRGPSNELYFIHRNGVVAGSGDGNMYFYVYDTGTQTWSGAAGTSTNGLLINGQGSTPVQSPYWNGPPVFDSNGDMHISWQWRQTGGGGSSNTNISYVKWDGSSFAKTTGSQTVPITYSNCEVANTIAAGSYLSGFGSMVIDSSDNPHIFTGYNSGGFSRIFRTYHNGSSWSATAVTPAKSTVLYHDPVSTNPFTHAAFIESDDTIHLVVNHPTGIGKGQYAYSSNGATWTDPWEFSVLTRQNVLAMDGTKTDMGCSHDRYQLANHGIYQSLVPLSSTASEEIDENDWPYSTGATISKGDSDIYNSFFVIDGAELPAHFWDNVKSDLSDVRLTDQNGMRLPCYVHSYNYGSSQAVIFGAFPDILPTTGVHEVFVHYGNASASAESASHEFGQYACFRPSLYFFAPSGGGNDITSYNQDLTASGAVSEGGASGPFGSLAATTYNGSSQYFSLTSAGLPGSPTDAAVIAWVKSTNTTASQTPIAQTDASSAYVQVAFQGNLASPHTDPIGFYVGPSVASAAFGADGYSANTWYHCGGLQLSTTSRYLVKNGVAGTQVTTSKATPLSSCIVVGAYRGSSVSQYFAGDVSMAQVYVSGSPDVDEVEWQYAQADQATFWGTWSEPASGPPSNSVAPAVTGTEANGKTLTSTSGTWSGSPTYAYQWYTNTAASTSGGTAITGATSSTFVLTDSQDDLYVYCVVTATNGEGSDSEPSNVVGPILGLTVVVKANPIFADAADFQDQTLINEAVGDAGAGEEMPAPSTWETDSPVGDVDWSAFTLAVDAAGINRSNRAGATLISPNYVVLAAHAPGDNTGHTWMTPAGAEVTRTLGSTPDVDYWELGTGDLAVAKLSSPINNITPMPLILDCSKVAGRDALCIEMDRHLNVFTIPTTLDNTDEDCTVSHSRASDGLESGDSGKPCVIIIDDTPVMVITAMYTASPGGQPFTGTGPNASHFIDEIFAITSEDGESPTVWDLRSGDDGAVSGNPGSSPMGQVTSSPTNMPISLLRKYHANAR